MIVYDTSYFLTFLPFFSESLSLRNQYYCFLILVSNFPNSFLLQVCVFSIIILVLRLFLNKLLLLFLIYFLLSFYLCYPMLFLFFFNFMQFIPAFLFFSLNFHLILLFVHQLKICNLIWHQRSGSVEKVLCVILCMAGFILQEHEVGYHLIGHFWMVSINSFSSYCLSLYHSKSKKIYSLYFALFYSQYDIWVS